MYPSKSQLKMIYLHSDKARQNITYTCLTSQKNHVQDALGSTSTTIKVQDTNARLSDYLKDQTENIKERCRQSLEGSKTIFEVTSTRLKNLPVTDNVLNLLINSGMGSFNVDVGPICFT